MPYDVAFLLPEHEVEAYTIIFGEQEGGDFDFTAWQWRRPNGG